jgi:hypothetical protein
LVGLTSVFHIIQGDEWNKVWYNAVRGVGSLKAHIYFIILLVLGKIIFLNSFIGIILGNFEKARNNADI